MNRSWGECGVDLDWWLSKSSLTNSFLPKIFGVTTRVLPISFFSAAFLSWKISLLAFKSITCPLLDLSKVFLLNKLGDKSCVFFQDDETFYLKLKFFRNPCCLFLGLSHHDSLTRGFCQDFLLPKHVYSLINIWLEILPFKCVFSF